VEKNEEGKRVECGLEIGQRAYIPMRPDLSDKKTGLVQWDTRLDLSG
jgi:hypothetical protein